MNFVSMFEEMSRKNVDVHGLSVGLGMAMIADAIVLLAESLSEVADALSHDDFYAGEDGNDEELEEIP